MNQAEAAMVDYGAATNEAMSNLEVRRLMLVLANVLTPACVMAVADGLSGSHVKASLAWLPPLVLPLCASILLVSGFLVTGVLARCHYGLVVNGTKLKKVETGKLVVAPLNWLGVTTNFLMITALSSALGALTLAASFGLGGLAWVVGALVFLAFMAWLPLSHRRAVQKCKQLDAAWQSADLPVALREEHARRSLEGTSSDISVVVVMAAALFAGILNALTNLHVNRDLVLPLQASTIEAAGPPLLMSFLFLSLLCSCRILVRLRLAFGEHSSTLARLRNEVDATALSWRWQERTYLLYAIVLTLLVATSVMLGFELAGERVALAAAALTLVAGAIWYPLVLRAARRRVTG